MPSCIFSLCFFHGTATAEIYTLSLHDALPIWAKMKSADILVSLTAARNADASSGVIARISFRACLGRSTTVAGRSEEHTSELQSRQYLVCRLLLEKKKKKRFILQTLYNQNRYV